MEKEQIEKIRHSLAHLLAISVLDFDKSAKMAIGPVIENGFYYDFEFSENNIPTEKDLKTFQKNIQKLIKKNLDFSFEKVTAEKAREIFGDQPYKLELIDELEKTDQEISVYRTGDFLDLCQGPHVHSTKEINPDSFEITKISGAYWRGDEKNKMLTRIYGVAFETKEELDNYKQKMTEAAERDHRKIGKEMNLWTFSEYVGAGLPMFTPAGTTIRKALFNALSDISIKHGWQEVTIPHLAKRKLYEISGHADKFGDELLMVHSHYDEFVLKPVNCPHHTQIFAATPHSYKDLPLRFFESTMQYRDEKPGEIGGLTRVRSITVDDGHAFCTPDQIKEEAKKIANIIAEFYTKLGMFGDHWVSLSVRDPQNKDGYIGSDENWDKAEQMLQEVSDELSLNAKVVEGEAAIYGPKLDYMFTDSLGRQTQLATIQIDFNMPERFGLEYTDQDGKKKTPVMIHRAILGSYERFLAILIEHFAGNFPLWLAPNQIKIIPIAENHLEKASEIAEQLRDAGYRIELDNSKDNFGKKIKKAKLEKVPYFIILGDKDLAENKMTIESRDEGNLGMMSLEEFIKKIS